MDYDQPAALPPGPAVLPFLPVFFLHRCLFSSPILVHYVLGTPDPTSSLLMPVSISSPSFLPINLRLPLNFAYSPLQVLMSILGGFLFATF